MGLKNGVFIPIVEEHNYGLYVAEVFIIQWIFLLRMKLEFYWETNKKINTYCFGGENGEETTIRTRYL